MTVEENSNGSAEAPESSAERRIKGAIYILAGEKNKQSIIDQATKKRAS